MKRNLVLALALTSALAGCSGSDAKTGAPVTGGSCTASGSGTTDLATKPVYTVPKDTTQPTETQVTDIVCGKGKVAAEGSSVVAKYVGLDFVTGKQFEASWDSAPGTFEFTVGGNVIPGFTKGFLGMKEGGRRLVVIPPADGYGDSGPVPGGTLAFIVDLVSVS